MVTVTPTYDFGPDNTIQKILLLGIPRAFLGQLCPHHSRHTVRLQMYISYQFPFITSVTTMYSQYKKTTRRPLSSHPIGPLLQKRAIPRRTLPYRPLLRVPRGAVSSTNHYMS